MLQDRTNVAACARLVLVLVTGSSLGCFAHSRGDIEWDETPVVNTGAGATILYPGQTAPTYPAGGSVPNSAGSNQPPGGGPGGAATTGSTPSYSSGPGGEQRSGSPTSGGLPVTMIGGAEQDIEGHLSWKQEPVWWKYLALPFAVIAAPFKAIADTAEGEPEAGPEIPNPRPPGLEAGGTPATVPTSRRSDTAATAPGAAPEQPREPEHPPDYESAMVEQLERELEQRRRSTAPSGSETAASRPTAGGGTHAPSIAEELAALQRRPDVPLVPASEPRPIERTASRQSREVQPTGDVADGVVDRDGDGRVDKWIYRENGEIARIGLDENGDGHVDRTLHYDADSHQIARVEEDVNGDGTSDSWTDYDDGRVARRRSDGNHDGNVDTWSFYRAGVITRHEQDTDGDGFRDRFGIYVDGRLSREDQDRDGDGHSDAAIYYDDSERISRREEDNDSDGLPDVISYYEAGRLSRRELLTHGSGAGTAGP